MKEIQIILVNGSYIGNDDIGKLMHDFRCIDPNEMYYDELKERSKYLKEEDGGHKIMCEVWEEIREEGREEGKNEKLLESISALMNSLNISLDKAMELLSVNEEEKQYCLKNLCD